MSATTTAPLKGAALAAQRRKQEKDREAAEPRPAASIKPNPASNIEALEKRAIEVMNARAGVVPVPIKGLDPAPPVRRSGVKSPGPQGRPEAPEQTGPPPSDIQLIHAVAREMQEDEAEERAERLRRARAAAQQPKRKARRPIRPHLRRGTVDTSAIVDSEGKSAVAEGHISRWVREKDDKDRPSRRGREDDS